jgi:putative transport protein
LLYITFALLKPKVAAPSGSGMKILEVSLGNPHFAGKTVAGLMSGLPGDVQIVARRRHITTNRPRPTWCLQSMMYS